MGSVGKVEVGKLEGREEFVCGDCVENGAVAGGEIGGVFGHRVSLMIEKCSQHFSSRTSPLYRSLG